MLVRLPRFFDTPCVPVPHPVFRINRFDIAIAVAVRILDKRAVEAAKQEILDLAFAALVLAFAREQGLVSRLLLTAPLRWLGVLSYGLYMVHGMVFGRIYDVLGLIQRRTGHGWVVAELGGMDRILLPTGPTALLVAAMLAVALACAWAAWRFVEWPARTYARRLAGGEGRAAQPA